MADRHCFACGLVAAEGPLPYEWDSHMVEGELVTCCSDDCRTSKGLTRRKPAHVPFADMADAFE